MVTDRKPTNVNIRNPAAIERILEEVRAGRARNYSEGAENLILGSLRDRTHGTQPIVGPDARDTGMVAARC